MLHIICIKVMKLYRDMARMYIFVNSDLAMDKGKACTQVGHAVQRMMEVFLLHGRYTAEYNRWRDNGCTKITLKATAQQIRELSLRPEAVYVVDAGLTQLPAGSLTVVCFPPLEDLEFKGYKLY